ncbi:MAG: YceI family protein [Terricaulis sp.]
MANSAARYAAVAIVLHWAIAAAILFNIPLGLWMHAQAASGHVDTGVFRAFQLHKSVGLTVLALSLARLAWRLMNPPPPLPAAMPKWERFAALTTHWAFYALMIALPLTGWLYVSAGWSLEMGKPLVVETHYFGLFKVPFLFGLDHSSETARASAAYSAMLTHWLMGWATLALAALHVAAALKHQFVDRDQVLGHMVPGVHSAKAPAIPGDTARIAVLSGGLALVALGLAVAVTTLLSPAPVATPSPPITTAIAGAPDATPWRTPPPQAAPTTAVTAAAPPPVAHAVAWSVDTPASSVGFTITYSGQPYEGAFDRWRADIRFSPDDLAHSSASVTMEVASAHTSDAMQTSQIGSTSWFDSANFPTATFRTSAIRHISGDRYETDGALTIKGHTQNVTLPFTLTIAGNRATMSGQLSLNRQAFGVGAGDASIGDQVAVKVRVVATRTP